MTTLEYGLRMGTTNLRDLTSIGAAEGFEPPEHYDRVTPAWQYLLGENLHYGVFSGGKEPLAEATDALTRLMADQAALTPSHRVLDVGCGTGAPACFISERHGCRVLGVSTSEVGLARARERAAARNLSERVSFALADGMANGLPDASFDRVWVMESSHLMPDKRRLLAECARVLEPGGRLVLCDLVLRRPMTTRDVVQVRYELLLLRDVFGKAKMEPLPWYAEELERLGFRDLRQTDLTQATLPTFDRWEENADRSRDQCVSLFGERSWQQFVQSAAVLRRFWQDGTLGYGLVAADRPGA